MSIFSRATGTVIPTVDVTTASARSRDVLLLDVREPAEWAAGHAPAAHHQPLGELQPATLPAADVIYVICQAGGRSERAVRTLRDAGLDARNVTGGMTAWAAHRLPVERD
jgi:rhodanese-related sulfurtransferase